MRFDEQTQRGDDHAYVWFQSMFFALLIGVAAFTGGRR
jgi:hypothetical protein